VRVKLYSGLAMLCRDGWGIGEMERRTGNSNDTMRGFFAALRMTQVFREAARTRGSEKTTARC